MERICKNCQFFNNKERVCEITVLIEGEKYELPVNPRDSCHWEKVDRELQEDVKTQMYKHPYFKERYSCELDKPIEINQIRIWSDGKNGYIERPV